MANLNSIGGLHYEMMKRCYNEKSVAYKDYGAKGIKVCEEWHDRENFRKWAKENGYVKGLRLERIDGKKDYEPNNCRFGVKTKTSSGVGKKYRETKKHRDKMKEFAGLEGCYSHTRIYNIYKGMIVRCYNKKDYHYRNYGARGIDVCDEWLSKDGFFYFYKWAMNNGYSDNLSIDRINNDKGYSPNNCRWATMKEQENNKRNSRNFNYNGKKMNLSDIAKTNNTTYGKMYSRVIDKGMSIEEAIQDIKNKSK